MTVTLLVLTGELYTRTTGSTGESALGLILWFVKLVSDKRNRKNASSDEI